MNTYNKSSNRAVIVGYPSWAGGKFIMNCLGISKHCYLQHLPLIIAQRNGRLSPQDKLDFLCQQLDKTQNEWTDLWLGDATMFVDSTNPAEWSDVINQISYEDCYFFAVAHSTLECVKLMSIWPNAKTIFVVNPESFIQFRAPNGRVQTNISTLDYRVMKPDSFQWDSAWSLNTITVVEQIEILYNRMGIDDFNKVFVSKFAQKYLEVITRLRELL